MFATSIDFITYEENINRNFPVLSESMCKFRSLVKDNQALSGLDFVSLINIGKMTATCCCIPEHFEKVDKVCDVLGKEKCNMDRDHYIITRAVFGNRPVYSLFRYYRAIAIMNEPEDQVNQYVWVAMSHLYPEASFLKDEEGAMTTLCIPSTGIRQVPKMCLFDIRKSTIQRLCQATYSGDNSSIQMWAFQTKPQYEEAVRRERIQYLLRFRRVKQVEMSDYHIATAAYTGCPLEFKKRLQTFTKRPDWKTRPIIPFRQYLECDSTNVDIDPQPLKYWLRTDVCIKIFGEFGYNKMMEYLIEYV